MSNTVEWASKLTEHVLADIYLYVQPQQTMTNYRRTLSCNIIMCSNTCIRMYAWIMYNEDQECYAKYPYIGMSNMEKNVNC